MPAPRFTLILGLFQFGMLYFEQRWRFIYTEPFQGPPPETAAR
jgi:hypothetical protein